MVEASATLERAGTGDLQRDDHLRGVRLVDVAQPRMVFDDLWATHHRGPGAFGDGVRNRRSSAALDTRADGACLPTAALSRPRKIAARLRDDLGLSVVLATA